MARDEQRQMSYWDFWSRWRYTMNSKSHCLYSWLKVDGTWGHTFLTPDEARTRDGMSHWQDYTGAGVMMYETAMQLFEAVCGWIGVDFESGNWTHSEDEWDVSHTFFMNVAESNRDSVVKTMRLLVASPNMTRRLDAKMLWR